VLACFESGDCVCFVEFIRGEDEDYVDVLALEDLGGVGGCDWNVELCCAVFGILRSSSISLGFGL
jgi:hypothetical protein